jgi:hypothetical protein
LRTTGKHSIDGLDLRNQLGHDYVGHTFELAEAQLRAETYPALGALHAFFLENIAENP